MTRALRIVPLLLAGMLALQGAAPAFAGKAQPRRESASVELVGVNHHGRERSGVRFDTDRVRSLLIQVSWKTLVGTHTQRLELITPDGSIYQTLTEPVESVTGTALVETRLSVAGTWITEYDLHGKWTVNVYLDDAVTPVTSARFTLVK
jgi:hypothetical protein